MYIILSLYEIMWRWW